MTTFTESIVQGRMAKLNSELETSLRMSGKTFESVTLGLGDTTLEREVLEDGTYGEIKISTKENDDLLGSSVTYQKYVLTGGEITPDTRFGERTVGKLRIATVLAKVAFGRVDHWDKESDFYGSFIDEVE